MHYSFYYNSYLPSLKELFSIHSILVAEKPKREKRANIILRSMLKKYQNKNERRENHFWYKFSYFIVEWFDQDINDREQDAMGETSLCRKYKLRFVSSFCSLALLIENCLWWWHSSCGVKPKSMNAVQYQSRLQPKRGCFDVRPSLFSSCKCWYDVHCDKIYRNRFWNSQCIIYLENTERKHRCSQFIDFVLLGNNFSIPALTTNTKWGGSAFVSTVSKIYCVIKSGSHWSNVRSKQ